MPAQMRVCEYKNCVERFVPSVRHPRQRYCCREHQIAACSVRRSAKRALQPKARMLRACEWEECGKLFHPNAHNQRFCCKRHKDRAAWWRPTQTRVCEYERCCNFFSTRNYRRRFCCTSHAGAQLYANNFEKLSEQARERRRLRNLELLPRACEREGCGRLFHPKPSHRRYCCKQHAQSQWVADNYERRRKRLNEDARRRRIENPEKFRAIARRSRLNNLEKVRERHARYTRENREKINEAGRRKYAKNREKINARTCQQNKKIRALARIAKELGFVQPGDL